MKRIALLFVALALIAAACSSSSVEESFEEVATDESRPEGPDAPDFTLALQPSGEFVLSQAVKPVYMIFWAEW
ncbi:MAG: hypothetical protein ACC683_07020 [Acidimicrobiia bacterium]